MIPHLAIARVCIPRSRAEFSIRLPPQRGSRAVTLTGYSFDFASIDDGNSAVARLYGACVLKRNAGGSYSSPLKAERLAEALLRHVDSRALCPVRG